MLTCLALALALIPVLVTQVALVPVQALALALVPVLVTQVALVPVLTTARLASTRSLGTQPP